MYICIYVLRCVYMCIYMCMYVMCIYVFICVYTCIYICNLCVYMSICAHMYAYMYACMCIYVYPLLKHFSHALVFLEPLVSFPDPGCCLVSRSSPFFPDPPSFSLIRFVSHSRLSKVPRYKMTHLIMYK